MVDFILYSGNHYLLLVGNVQAVENNSEDDTG